MSPPASSTSPDPAESSSSRTPTVRNVSSSSSSQAFGLFAPAENQPQAGPSSEGLRRKSDMNANGNGQEELGKGRPGRDERLSAPLSPLQRSHSPSAFSTYSTSDETDDPSPYTRRSRTPGPRLNMSGGGGGEHTPRLVGSQRGQPTSTATGSAFGSPQTQFSNTGSAPRSARLPRNNSTSGHPMSYPVNPNATSHPYGGGYGSVSRSTSRARPPLSTQNTSFGIATLGRHANANAKPQAHEEDDEAPIVDRGEDLIRRRQQERKQARKKKERERRIAGDTDGSAPPTGTGVPPGPEDSFLAQQQRSLGPAAGRSVSRTRAASATRVKKEPSEGYFTMSYAGSLAGNETPTPRDDLLSPRAALRPASIYSSTADEDEDEEEREREAIDDVIADVVEEATEQDIDVDVEEEEAGEADEGASDEGVTLRDRQDAINIEHPFGLPIWKPALYRKSRSVTRNAESALHSIPSAAAERHLLPGNIAWVVIFGWWLSIICFAVALAVSGAEVLGGGRGGYGKTLRGLAWYIGWPFGKYVEGEGAPDDEHEGDNDHDNENGNQNGYGGTDDSPVRRQREVSDGGASNLTVRQSQNRLSHNLDDGLPDEPRQTRREATVSFANTVSTQSISQHSKRTSYDDEERAPLLSATSSKKGFRRPRNRRAKILGRIIYWPLFLFVLAPIMLVITTICWFCIITIPMAKLNWALLNLLYSRPLEINFRSAPKIHIPVSPQHSPSGSGSGVGDGDESGSTTLNESSPDGSGTVRYRRAHLKAGQVAPTSGPKSTVLLCTYRAVGSQYYKYTVGGVNIIFINLIPLVFFTIFDAFVLLPAVERDHSAGRHPPPFLNFIASQALIFVLSLSSVIPLSYFIGMAVASISAQSSIGMGAVINATFGSIIEIILYAIALTQGKGRLVEGSIVGSILAGVLLMPGASMISGAFKRKEQKFNAKSAGVTSTMLIMAIIGTLTPTMFYQTYGTFELHCDGCPPIQGQMRPQDAWQCQRCYYEHPDPSSDPFYQDQVKTLMYCCAGILLFSYLIGLWFSLRTHASQIWQNPQQLLKPDDPITSLHPAVKASLSQRLTPQAIAGLQHVLPLHVAGKDRQIHGTVPNTPTQPYASEGLGRSPIHGTIKLPKVAEEPSNGSTSGSDTATETGRLAAHPSASNSRISSAAYNLPEGYTPFLDGLQGFRGPDSTHMMPSAPGTGERLPPMRLPSSLTTEDFTRAVAVATVSALRHQGSIIGNQSGGGGGTQGSARKERPSLMLSSAKKDDREEVTGGAVATVGEGHGEGHGGHEAPEWTRAVSAGVLLSCTLLYALIAEILVDVVDVVLENIKIDEKFLGLTLFTLIPNVTEFMNAMSFALNGNIALSMEIGSAYALQVCLLQIPAMVAFSAFYDPGKMGEMVDTFTLIFPRWDVIAIILSIFLLTYTYIEARSNYHRGSILVLAYIVLVMGFYYAPERTSGDGKPEDLVVPALEVMGPGVQSIAGSWSVGLTKLWA